MLSPRIAAGVRAGLVSAASTAGAITGFGLRRGDWAGAFSSLGTQVLAGLHVPDPPRLVAALFGAGAHAVFMVGWGLCFAAIAHRRERAWAIGVAVAVALSATLAASTFVPVALGAVRSGGLTSPQVTLCIALMIGGLLAGRALPQRVT